MVFVFVCVWKHMCVETHDHIQMWRPKVDVWMVLGCFSVLLIEAGSFSQTQSWLIWLVSLAALLQDPLSLPSKAGNVEGAGSLPSIRVDSGAPNLGLHSWVALSPWAFSWALCSCLGRIVPAAMLRLSWDEEGTPVRTLLECSKGEMGWLGRECWPWR